MQVSLVILSIIIFTNFYQEPHYFAITLQRKQKGNRPTGKAGGVLPPKNFKQ